MQPFNIPKSDVFYALKKYIHTFLKSSTLTPFILHHLLFPVLSGAFLISHSWESTNGKTKRGSTHMFCRAMDSRRSVMEGRDETEKEGREEQEILSNFLTNVPNVY